MLTGYVFLNFLVLFIASLLFVMTCHMIQCLLLQLYLIKGCTCECAIIWLVIHVWVCTWLIVDVSICFLCCYLSNCMNLRLTYRRSLYLLFVLLFDYLYKSVLDLLYKFVLTVCADIFLPIWPSGWLTVDFCICCLCFYLTNYMSLYLTYCRLLYLLYVLIFA